MTDLNLLKSRIAALQSPSAAAHPDSNTFAAHAANTITSEERAAFLSHLALCPDCREAAFLTTPLPRPDASKPMHWLAFAAAIAIAALVCYAPELRSLATQKHIVNIAKSQAPAIVFIPPPPAAAPAAPKQKPVIVQAPPILPPSPLPALMLPLPAMAAARPPNVIRLSPTIAEPSPLMQTSFLPANARVTLPGFPQWRIAADPSSLQRSTDSGRNWEPVHIPGITGVITTIDPKSGSHLQIETTSGEHWQTYDAGAHWTRTL